MSCHYRARPGRLLAILLGDSRVRCGHDAGHVSPSRPIPARRSMSPQPRSCSTSSDRRRSTRRSAPGCATATSPRPRTTRPRSSSRTATTSSCSAASCHTRFPHRPTGTSRPTMKGCFDCHGLRHGPMGIIATDECEDCHVTPRWQRTAPRVDTRPTGPARGTSSRRTGQAQHRVHALPQGPDVHDCHDQKGIVWTPETGWDYDSGDGCLSCHGSSNLQKQTNGVVEVVPGHRARGVGAPRPHVSAVPHRLPLRRQARADRAVERQREHRVRRCCHQRRREGEEPASPSSSTRSRSTPRRSARATTSPRPAARATAATSSTARDRKRARTACTASALRVCALQAARRGVRHLRRLLPRQGLQGGRA